MDNHKTCQSHDFLYLERLFAQITDFSGYVLAPPPSLQEHTYVDAKLLTNGYYALSAMRVSVVRCNCKAVDDINKDPENYRSGDLGSFGEEPFQFRPVCGCCHSRENDPSQSS